MNPIGYMGTGVDAETLALSREICADAADGYEKLLRIHDWVAENIYYDSDFLNGRGDEKASDALAGYQSKRTLCAGYARLTQVLIQA